MITAPDRLRTPVEFKPVEPTAADVLRAARDRLNSEGWCKQVSLDHDGSSCLSYAIHRGARTRGGPVDEALFIMKEEIGCPNIPAWNDAHERTFEDVQRALDSAIYRAECRPS